MDRMVNYIRLTCKLACMLSIYRTCNSTVGLLKYEFNNKLLGVITLLRVTPRYINLLVIMVYFLWHIMIDYSWYWNIL